MHTFGYVHALYRVFLHFFENNLANVDINSINSNDLVQNVKKNENYFFTAL